MNIPSDKILIQILFWIFLFFHKGLSDQHCLNPIYKIELPECSSNTIGMLGKKNTYEYGKILFDENIIFTETQKNCVLNNDDEIGVDINKCIVDITINNQTNPEKVARGLALNSDGRYVSACAENMPCLEFNMFVYNRTFQDMLRKCGAYNKFLAVLDKTDLIQSSWYGYQYCQNLNPKTCVYKEKDTCQKDKIYACPVSRWVYASNFILLYMLSPSIASTLPNCRII